MRKTTSFRNISPGEIVTGIKFKNMTSTQIKFSNKTQTDFVNELRNQVKDYFESGGISKYGGYRIVLKSIFMFSLYLIPYFLMVTGVVTRPDQIFLLWIIMGFGTAGIGMAVMHDANHRSYSKYQSVNRILSYSLNFLGGFAPTWQYQHNTLHHGFTNIDGFDEDIDAGKMFRFSPNKPLYKIHKFQQFYAWFFYGLMTFTWTLDKDFKQIYRYRKEGVVLSQNKSFGSLLAELIISKVIYYGYLLVIPILFLPVPWWLVVFFYFCMHLISGFILGIIFQTAHVMPSSEYPLPDDNGTIENNWAIHQLLTTTDYSPHNRVFSWFIGGLNYQVEHHLFANISHIHYHNISAIVQRTALKYHLPYHVRKSFPRALYDHFRMLKTLGTPAVA